MNPRSLQQSVGYYHTFHKLIEHTRVIETLYFLNLKEKNNIISIHQELISSNNLANSLADLHIIKAFIEFLEYYLTLLSNPDTQHKNNHYFIDSILRNFKKNNYWNISFSGCYQRFKDLNQNKISLIETYFKKENSIQNYINEFIVVNSKSNWNDLPKTTFISDYTEYFLNVDKIETNFLKLIRSKFDFENMSLIEKNIIYKYASLSMVRNPILLNISFNYFFEYFIKNKEMSLYDYLSMKFCFHIISYTNFFKYFKMLKTEYSFKIITTDKFLIASDNQLNMLLTEEQDFYTLTLNENSFILFYKKEYKEIPPKKQIIEKYEINNLFSHAESIFIPNQYNIEQIKKVIGKKNDFFQNILIFSIDPCLYWNFLKSEEGDRINTYNKLTMQNISYENFWNNGYFLKTIKDFSLYFDREVIKKQIYSIK